MRTIFTILAVLFLGLSSPVFSVEDTLQNELTSTVIIEAGDILNQLEQGERLKDIFEQDQDHFSADKYLCCYGPNGPSTECRRNARSRSSCERKKGCQWMC